MWWRKWQWLRTSQVIISLSFFNLMTLNILSIHEIKFCMQQLTLDLAHQPHGVSGNCAKATADPCFYQTNWSQSTASLVIFLFLFVSFLGVAHESFLYSIVFLALMGLSIAWHYCIFCISCSNFTSWSHWLTSGTAISVETFAF